VDRLTPPPAQIECGGGSRLAFCMKVTLLLCGVVAALVLAPSALAATVSVNMRDGVLSYLAGTGEANQLTLVRSEEETSSSSVRLIDRGATIAAGEGCSSVSDHEAVCAGVVSALVHVGDLDDSVTVVGTIENCCDGTTWDEVAVLIPATITGGDGDDTLTGSDARDLLSGNAGADALSAGRGLVWDGDEDYEYPPVLTEAAEALSGGAGEDVLYGGPGPDNLGGGEGSDLVSGGAGFDSTSYWGRTAPVFVSLDDLPGDGIADENDNVGADVERVIGTTRSDVLIGSDEGIDVLRGGPGDDRLDGRGAPGDEPDRDLLVGGDGSDRIDGGRGDDAIRGDGGNDVINGGLDNDYVEGGSGRDVLSGSDGRDEIWGDSERGGASGNDMIRGGRGRDRVHGGAGRDTFYIRDGVADRLWGGRGFDRARIDHGLDVATGVNSFF
jgi:Ca2+-binding RTX toxin-like protein